MRNTSIFLHIVCYTLIFIHCICYANDDLSKIQNQIKQTEQQNKQIEQQINTSTQKVKNIQKQLINTSNQVNILEKKRDTITKHISELDKQYNAINSELTKNYNTINDATSGILLIASNPIIDSTTMHDYVLTSAILFSITEQFDTQIQDAVSKIQHLDNIRHNKHIEKEHLDKNAQKYSQEQNNLTKLLKTRSAQNQQLKQKQIEIQKKLAKLSEKAKNLSELSASVGSFEILSDAKLSKRKLNPPVNGKLNVRYGETTALGLKSNGWRIITNNGALVKAPADGTIKFAGNFRRFGKVIIISHKNGYNTIMTNMNSINVFVEQEVLAGEPIGKMNQTKSEMYIEIIRNNQYIDPAHIFKEP